MAQIPQYTRGLIKQREVAQVYNPQAISNAGQNYGQAFAQAADWADKYAVAEETTAVNEAVIRKQKEDIDFIQTKQTEWQNNPTGYAKAIDAEMKKRNEQYMATLPSTRAKEAFKQTAARIDLSTYEQAAKWEKTRGVEIIGNRLDTSLNELNSLASTVGSYGGNFDDIKKNLDASLVAASTVLAADEIDKLKAKQMNDLASTYLIAKATYSPEALDKDLRSGKFDDMLDGPTRIKLQNAAWDSLPDLKKIQGGYTPDGSFSSAMAVVETNEGGYTPVDGASGAPAIYGINRKWHQEAHDEARRITLEKGEAAGKAYAKEFYKKEYWDKYGIGKLPEATRAVVMDGAVNHRAEFVQELIAKAKAGASQQELIDMRRDEYLRLAQDPAYAPSLNGWMRRLGNFKRVGSQEQIEQAQERIAKDPVKAMQEIGVERPSDYVAMQKERGISEGNARVLSNAQAVEYGNQIANITKTDEIVGLANQIKETYGAYEGNALRDIMTQAKVPATKAAALSLAAKNQVQYREHIELLMKADEKAEKETFKDLGKSEKDLETQVQKKYEETAQVLRDEGYSPAEINSQINIITTLARSRMLSSPSDDYDDAVEFAMQPDNEAYLQKSFNGMIYRIPKKYNAEKIADNLDDAFEDMTQPLKNEFEKRGYKIRDGVRLYLNHDETAIAFETIKGEKILFSDGRPFEIGLDILENYKSKSSKGIYPSYSQGKGF